MTITIAGTAFRTRKPQDLDAALIAATGCNATETLAIISGVPLPGRLAAAVTPFLGEDAPLPATLAAAIESDLAGEASTLVADIRKLFTSAEVPPTVVEEG